MTPLPDPKTARSMTGRMRAGDLWIADGPDIVEAANTSIDLMAYKATTPRQEPLRHELLSGLLGAIGEDTAIRPPLYIDYGSKLRSGHAALPTSASPASTSHRTRSDVQIGPACSC